MKSQSPIEKTGRDKILIVDDSLESINILLKHLGSNYKVVPAKDGKTALDLCTRTSVPDLILLDVVMPEMNGYEVCEILKSNPETADIPILFLTACDDVENEIKGLKLGAVDYITKPFSTSILQARIKTHLELKKARQTLKKQNDELIEAARLKDDVERMAHHDLKTPLNALVSLPSLVMESPFLRKTDREVLKVMEQAAFDVLNMVNISLDLYKMEQGQYKYSPIDVNLKDIIQKILNELTVLIKGKHISFKYILNNQETALPEFLLKGETLLFYSMFSNILKNALEASPMGETITISFETEPCLTVKIRNKGEVAPEIRNTFFNKYTTHGKINGTGLGTYSAFLITQTIGGNIDLDTSESGHTSIMVTFPPL